MVHLKLIKINEYQQIIEDLRFCKEKGWLHLPHFHYRVNWSHKDPVDLSYIFN